MLAIKPNKEKHIANEKSVNSQLLARVYFDFITSEGCKRPRHPSPASWRAGRSRHRFSLPRRFARQRVAECVGCGEISFQGLDGIDSQDGLQVSLVRRPSVWMRNKSPVK